ncbi:hypothetical protein E4V42_22605 [Clostridium estertheticum]|uniref:Uncharacterized protein n=2 Tax=Clostridium estertheticum TaxID=238834 RepID=A0A5N7IV55_9CLOT|nr:hypothetical protein [Clostridium estertheticum]MPQ64603.1 hypothetical protein [Clostridium estertheticum]
MSTMKKKLIECVLICLICIGGIYEYVNINQKNDFKITNVDWDAEAKNWTDNTKNNMYDIKFQILNGTDLKEIKSSKPTYTMKIDSTVEKGELKIKIYNDKKILFEKDGTTNKTITVSNEDSENVKIEITGKKAESHVKIKLT